MNFKMMRTLFRTDLLLYVREPAAAFFTFAFPVLLLSILGAIFGHYPHQFTLPDGTAVDTTYISIFFPGFVAFIIANLWMMSAPIFLANQRISGWFRMLQLLPLRLSWVIVIRVLLYFAIFVFSYAFMYLLARQMFDLRFFGQLLPFGLALMLCFASFGSVGFMLGGLFNSASTTQAVASIFFFALYFTSGSAIPRDQFPDWLFRATELNPMTHVVDLLVDVWTGQTFDQVWVSALVVALVGVAGFVLIPLTFRWDAEG
ncbi:MAG: ABC transporter permease [Caldilineaceae bacterium SB0662_bin_9]|uniref:Transport permease protein n=1 Tax=Caldilineaceae bacterium SB0662_bin_9 TaxID=2605258 RepID=A0A6B1DUC9_9CHLR|nr:ABC transporter permease [Caldilineaceae bacterium SB0662_bin_9]